MKKIITIVLTILSILLILDSLNAGHALMMLFLAGIIPGTTISIDAARMLEFFAVLAGFTLARVSVALLRLASTRRMPQTAKA